jgi:hypothetical protein
MLTGIPKYRRFPELSICIRIIDSFHVEKENEHIKRLKKAVYKEVRAKYNIETQSNGKGLQRLLSEA